MSVLKTIFIDGKVDRQAGIQAGTLLEWSTYCHSSMDDTPHSPATTHKHTHTHTHPCCLGLKAAAVFIWSVKTLLPRQCFSLCVCVCVCVCVFVWVMKEGSGFSE